MPHGDSSLLRASRRLWPLALGLCSSVVACSRTGTVTVLLEGTAGGGDSLYVYALSRDPAGLGPLGATGSSPGRPRAPDDVSRALALDDSARAADTEFQRARAWVNEEARALRVLDRRSRDYAQRWDAWRAREMAAMAHRSARDRLRARAESHRARVGSSTAQGTTPAAIPPRSALDSAVAAGVARRVYVSADRAVLALEPGTWWLGAARRTGVPRRFVPTAITSGSADTVRLRAH